MTTTEKIIKKQAELIKHYKAFHDSFRSPAVKIINYNDWIMYGKNIESELLILKAEMENDKPDFRTDIAEEIK